MTGDRFKKIMVFLYFMLSVMASAEMIEKLATKATAAEQMIQILTKQIEEIKANQGKGDFAQEVRKLRSENAQLKNEILEAKKKLIEAEKAAGISQIEATPQQVDPEKPVPSKEKAKESTPPKKEKAKKEKKEPEKKADGGGDSVDIGREVFTQICFARVKSVFAVLLSL